MGKYSGFSLESERLKNFHSLLGGVSAIYTNTSVPAVSAVRNFMRAIASDIAARPDEYRLIRK